MTLKIRTFFINYLLVVGLLPGWLPANAEPANPPKRPYVGYLFAYFTGNEQSEEGIRFAISGDGYHFRTLNNNQPVVSSKEISSSGGVRDPNIIRGKDGKSFFMVATDMVSAKGWDSNRGMVLMRSTDLVHWTSSAVNIQTRYPGQEKLERVWAPETIYDDSAGKYMVYFSMKYRDEPDKIYYAYVNRSFTNLEGPPSQLFYKQDGGACIDADIARANGRYYLFFKTEDSRPGIKVAVSDHLTRGYTLQSDDYVQQTTKPVEGAGTFPLNDGSGYILMYDMYTSGEYQFTKTTDFRTFAVVDSGIDMNFHPRHGTILSIKEDEARRLASQWMFLDASLLTPANKAIVAKDTTIDEDGSRVILHVRPGTDVHHFSPGFIAWPGVSITPALPQDFSGGAVPYTIRVAGRKKTYFVSCGK